MIEQQNPYGNLPSYCAYLSVDWGHSINCFHLHQPANARVERLDVQADPCSMRTFVGLLRERFPSGKILILSEQKKGALVNLLLDFDFIDLFAINPHAACAFRKSLHPSGAKNDPIDSSALLRMLNTHRDRMYPLSRDHEVDRKLDQLSRHRRCLVGEQLRVASRLEDLLKNYYPQALSMLGPDIWSPISLAFLRKWSTYSQLMKSRDETLRKFYTTHKKSQQGRH